MLGAFKRFLRFVLPRRGQLAIRHARMSSVDRRFEALNLSVPLDSGLTVHVRSRAEWLVFLEIFVRGEYDRAVARAIEGAGDDPLIVDLGANMGFFALRFADRWIAARGPDERYTMVAVEGAPEVHTELLRRLAQAALRDRVEAHLGLVGRREGRARIYQSPFHIANSVMTTDAALGTPASYIDVERLLPPGRPIRLLKCDIEGAEEAFLDSYGPLLDRVELAVIEFHRTMVDVDRCLTVLAAHGLQPSALASTNADLTLGLFERDRATDDRVHVATETAGDVLSARS